MEVSSGDLLYCTSAWKRTAWYETGVCKQLLQQADGRDQPEGRHGGNELEAVRELGQGIGDLGTCV